jgi:hypothetical protein
MEVIARGTNRYGQKLLENMPHLKVKSRTHCWKETNRIEIMKLLVFFLLQKLHQKLDNRSSSVRGGFTLYSGFFILLTTKVTMRSLVVPKDCKLKPYWVIEVPYLGVYIPQSVMCQ